MSNITPRTPEEIYAEVIDLVIQVAAVPVDQVVPHASFAQDLDVDSLSLLEIMTGIEERFGTPVPDGQVKELARVEDLVAFVRRALV